MFFPVCIDIENKKCLVIGGGKIAYKKIKTLSRYNSDITVIAEEIKEEVTKAVSYWREIAAKYKISSSEIERKAKAFRV